MKKIIVLLFLTLSTVSYAANPPSTNSTNKPSTTLAQDLSKNPTTGYKEISNVEVKPGSQTVSASYSDSIVKDGTRQGITIDAVKVEASKAEVAAELAKRWGRRAVFAGNAIWLGSEITRALLDAVDYVMDPKNNSVQKKPQDDGVNCGSNGSNCAYSEYYYGMPDSGYFSTPASACQNIASSKSLKLVKFWIDDSFLKCQFQFQNGNSWGVVNLAVSKNPSYNANAQQPAQQTQEVTSQDEFQKILNDALARASAQQVSQATQDAYTPISSTGQATTSVAQATTTGGLNAPMQNIISTAQQQLANSPDTATATDGGTTTGTTTSTTTTNPDGTTTTTSSTSSKLPAFCSWATAICDFIDWFKKDPELPDVKKLDIDELKIDSYQYEQHAQFGNSCPFQAEDASISLGDIGAMNFTKDLTPFCDYATEAKPFVIALGHLGALIFLIVGLRGQSNG